MTNWLLYLLNQLIHNLRRIVGWLIYPSIYQAIAKTIGKTIFHISISYISKAIRQKSCSYTGVRGKVCQKKQAPDIEHNISIANPLHPLWRLPKNYPNQHQQPNCSCRQPYYLLFVQIAAHHGIGRL